MVYIYIGKLVKLIKFVFNFECMNNFFIMFIYLKGGGGLIVEWNIFYFKKKRFKVVMSRDYRFLRNIMLFVSLVVVYEYL